MNYTVYYGVGDNEKSDADRVLSDLYEEKKGKIFASDAVQMTIYESAELTVAETIGKDRFSVAGMVEFSATELPEDIVKVSEYNRLARLYGLSKLEVPEGTYAIVCDYEVFEKIRNPLLKEGKTINIDGKTYTPAYEKCQYGFFEMMTNHANSGFVVLPDDSVQESWKREEFLAANYQADSRQEREEKEKLAAALETEEIDFTSKIEIIELSGGLSATITFMAIYLGIIFLLASAALLALKELSESSDNKERYEMLRKIGADEALIKQGIVSSDCNFLFPSSSGCTDSFYFWYDFY